MRFVKVTKARIYLWSFAIFIEWGLGPLLSHLHPSPSVKVQEPFIPNMLPGDEFRQHLAMATGWMWPSGAVTFFKGAEVGTDGVHTGVELGDTVLIARVVAVV